MRNRNTRTVLVQRLLPVVALTAGCFLSGGASYAQDLFGSVNSQNVDTRPTGIGAMLQFHVALGGDASEPAKPVWSLTAGTTRQTTYDSDGLNFGYKPGIGVAFVKNAPASLALGSVDMRQVMADRQAKAAIADYAYTDVVASPAPAALRSSQP